MNDKRILNNIGISMVMKPISMLLSFIYTPLVLAFLGDEKYGVWAIILNIVSWINYFDIGIGNGLRNKLTESIALGDEDSANKYVSTAYAGITLVSLAFCAVTTFTWIFLGLSDFFNLSLEDENTNFIVFISVLFICINFVLSLSKTSAYAIQQPSIISVVGVVGQLLQIGIIVVISRIFNQSLLIVALMYGIVSLFDSVAVYLYVTAGRKYLVPSPSAVDMSYMRPLLALGAGFFVMQICSLVLNSTDNLLISNLYGSADVTPYNLTYKVFYIAVQVHGIIIMPMWSAYTEVATRHDMAWIRTTRRKVDTITLLFALATFAGIIVFRPITSAWLGRDLAVDDGLIVTISIYMVAQMFANNYSSLLCGVGHIGVPVIVSIVGAVLNVPLSAFLARECGLGLTGIILGSLAVMLLSTISFPVTAARWINARETEWSEATNE